MSKYWNDLELLDGFLIELEPEVFLKYHLVRNDNIMIG